MKKESFSRLIKKFELAHDQKGKDLNLHSLLIKEEEVFLHHFREEAQASDIRSISKSILTLAFGRVMKLANEGNYAEINEETKIFPIIKDQFHLENKANLERIKKIRIKDLLTHRIGFGKVLMMRDDIKEMDPFGYVDYILNEAILHEPGDYYLYSNAGFYLLSVVLEEFIQEDLLTFLEREFFGPLGIQKVQWEKYGNYLAGATRLWLKPEELVKFGELFLNQGRVAGEEFIAKKWLEKMIRPRIRTEGLEPSDWIFSRDAYGYGIWLADAGFYFGHGTAGQRLIVLPEEEIILVLLADQFDTKAIDQIIEDWLKEKKDAKK